jgi:hypothetical protein
MRKRAYYAWRDSTSANGITEVIADFLKPSICTICNNRLASLDTRFQIPDSRGRNRHPEFGIIASGIWTVRGLNVAESRKKYGMTYVFKRADVL